MHVTEIDNIIWFLAGVADVMAIYFRPSSYRTKSMEHGPLEAVTHLVEFPAFYEIRRFITVFTRARH